MRSNVRFFNLMVPLSMILCLCGLLLIAVPQTQAASADTLSVTCTRTHVSGTAAANAPYVRVQVTLASDLTQVIATKVVRVNRRDKFTLSVHYPRQPRDTLLVVSVGDWDGQNYLSPALLQSRHCNPRGGDVPGGNSTPTPSLPTPVMTDLPPTPIMTDLPPTPIMTDLPPTPVMTDLPPTWVPTQPPFEATPTWIIGYAEFYADSTVITEGSCVTLHYWVINPSILTLHGSFWEDAPVTLLGDYGAPIVCPSAEAGYVSGQPALYTLSIVYLDGSTDSRVIAITSIPQEATWVPTLPPVEATSTPSY